MFIKQCVALILGVVVTTASEAAAVDFDVAGQFSTSGNVLARPFSGGSFSGTFSVDTGTVIPTTGAQRKYAVTAFDIDLFGPLGANINLDGPNRTGGALDEGRSFFTVFAQETLSIPQGFELAIYDLYDDPAATTGVNQRFLRLQFDALSSVPLVDSFAELAAADPDFGGTSRFEGGAMQFAISNSPLINTSASVVGSPTDGDIGAEIAPVPLPAAAWMLLAGLGGIGVVGRRRTRAQV